MADVFENLSSKSKAAGPIPGPGARPPRNTFLPAALRTLFSSVLLSAATSSSAQLFQLPTANHALWEKEGEERFFVGTTGKPWQSGTFGCVRSEGYQMHEGLDIRCIKRDKRREPTDPVMASCE